MIRAVFAAKAAPIFDHILVVDCKANGAKSRQEKVIEGDAAMNGCDFEFRHQVIWDFHAGLHPFAWRRLCG